MLNLDGWVKGRRQATWEECTALGGKAGEPVWMQQMQVRRMVAEGGAAHCLAV